MPIYEYRCRRCRRVSSILVRSFSAAVEPVCGQCGSTDLDRLMSRFAVLRSEEDRLDRMADPDRFGGFDENDPRSVARWARRMGAEMGEDLGPEFDEAIEQMEAGDMPDELGDGGSGFGEPFGNGYGADVDDGTDAED